MRIGRLTLVNAGTLHYADMPAFAVLDTEANFVQFFDIDDGGSVLEAERVSTRTTV